MRHVWKARPETIVVRSDQRVRSLIVDVIAQRNQRATRVAEIDSAGGIGDDDGFNPGALKHADRKRHLLGGVAFVQMHTALHADDRNVANTADHKLADVADGSRLREVRNFLVWNARRVSEFVGERSES